MVLIQNQQALARRWDIAAEHEYDAGTDELRATILRGESSYPEMVRQMQSRVDEGYAVGRIHADEAVRDMIQFEAQAREVGLGRIEADVTTAVSDRDRFEVNAAIDKGIEETLLPAGAETEAFRAGAMYQIYKGEVTDQVLAMAPNEGLAWINNNKNATELQYEDREEIFTTLWARRDRDRKEAKYQRDEKDLQLYDHGIDTYDNTPSVGLDWLEVVKVEMSPQTYEHLKGRWTVKIEDPDEPPSGYPDKHIMDTNYYELYSWVVDTQPEARVAHERFLQAQKDLLIDKPRVDALLAMVADPTKVMLPIYGWIDNAVAAYKDLSESDRDSIVYELTQMSADLQIRPDGSQRLQGEILDAVNAAAKNFAEPAVLDRRRELLTDLETQFREGGRRGIGRDEDVLSDLQDRRIMFGILLEQPMYSALASGITPDDDNEAEQFLLDHFMRAKYEGRRTWDSLDEREQKIIRNNARTAMLNQSHLNLYTETVGTRPFIPMAGDPRVSEVYILEDGTVAFVGPERALVQLRIDPDEKDERWYERRSGGWFPADYLNELNPPAEIVDVSITGRIATAAEAVAEAVTNVVTAGQNAADKRESVPELTLLEKIGELDISRLNNHSQLLIDRIVALLGRGDDLSRSDLSQLQGILRRQDINMVGE